MLSRVLLLSACLIVVGASAGFSAIPNAAQSTTPTGITLVGEAGTPDPVGSATYVIRNVIAIPRPQTIVTLDFSNCTDVRLASDMVAPGTTVNCASHVVSGITDGQGRVTFILVGSGAPGPPRTTPDCLLAYADGIPLRHSIVSVLDRDGMNGVNGVDLAYLATDLFSGQYRALSDFDADGHVDGIDLGIAARALFGGGSTASGTLCP